METLTIQRILDTKGSGELFTVEESTCVTDLIHHACERDVGALLITDASGNLVGIVSERDVMRQYHAGIDFDTTPVSEIMTRALITATPEDDMYVAMDLMVTKRIRHLPIVSGKTIYGLITVRDLIRAIRVADEQETKLLVEYLQKSLEDESTG